MNAKHTPGPWTVDTIRDPKTISHVDEHPYAISAGDWMIAHGSLQSRETMANAHLIAAAPDMLEWIQRVVSEHDRFMLGGKALLGDTLKTDGTAIIAKATGQN